MAYKDAETRRVAARRRYAVNPEKYKQLSRKFRENQSEASRVLQHATYRRYHGTLKGRYAVLKSRARKAGLELSLSFLDYTQCMTGSKCFYCFQSLSPTGSGLDRKDYKQGYTKENVAPCCASCNRRKGRLEGLGFSPSRCVELLQELIGGNRVHNTDYSSVSSK